MWIKFDGKSDKVELTHPTWDKPKTFTLPSWVHIIETNDNLYIDGEEVKE